MQNDWILDVIRDLKAFATLNGLDHLAAKLDETSEVARTELGVAGYLTGVNRATSAGEIARGFGRSN